MKILQVVEPGLDGVFRHVEGLTDFLLQGGHQIFLAYSDRRSSDRLYQLIRRVESHGGETLNLRVRNAPQPSDLLAAGKLWQFISRVKPDVGHAHSSKAGVLLRALAAMRGLPSFYTPNAYYGMGERQGFVARAFDCIEFACGKIGTTINVSEDEATFARERLKVSEEDQVIIPNAVDVSLFQPGSGEGRAAWRQEHGMPADAIVLGTLGRLSFQKDPLTLYRAFRELAERHPLLYLAHVGKGELAEECQALIREFGLGERIIRIDYLANPASFYSVLDGFVLSSRYEGLSFAALEALSAGLPLILTDVPGNREFQRFGLTHLWTSPPDDPPQLAAALDAWVQDRALARPCNHRTIAQQRFSFEACYGRIVELYRESVKSASAPRVRVAVISEPGKAGVKTHVIDILRHVDLSRFEVAYYYSNARSDENYPAELAELKARGIICHEVPMEVELKVLSDVRSFFGLLRQLRRFQPHVLHLHSSKAGGLGRLVRPLLPQRAAVLYTPNAMACYRSTLYRILEQILGWLTDTLIAVSASEKTDFICWDIPRAEQAALLRVGVRPVPPQVPHATNGTWTIGACGRICYQKNALLFFLTALAMIERDPALRFRWIGDFADDEESDQVRELLAAAEHPPQISVTGWVSNPYAEMSRLNTFCMFSRYESFGYVTADAMLLEVPVVAIAATGTRDLILHEDTGLIAPAEVEPVAEGLRRVQSDHDLCVRLTRSARAFIEQKHTIDGMVRQMEELYTEAARRHARFSPATPRGAASATAT